MISQLGQINTTALYVPDVYIIIVPPNITLLNGVPTNIMGVVGTASWGPVGAPTTVSNAADYYAQFGPIMARKYDAGTQWVLAVMQGAANGRIVRVTDGTDTAASIIVLTNCITLTSKWSGTFGNNITVTFSAGSQASTTKAVVTIPGRVPEIFDNIAGSGNALWVALASAINNGVSGLRSASDIIVASAGVGVTAPSLNTVYTLTGGTDGTTTITGSVLLGVDTIPRKGMYALRSTDTSIALLADCDDSTTWSTQVSFGLAEGMYMVAVGPAGDSIANAVTTKNTAGIDTFAMKLMLGDWVYFNDTVNNLPNRLVSPQGCVAGLMANQAPNQSTLNKKIWGINGTQKALTRTQYSYADLQTLAQNGIDVIANPEPGGYYYGCRIGHNTSSNAVTNGDNYTRLTNYIAATLNRGMGIYIGQLQTAQVRRNAKATLDAFFAAMSQQGLIGTAEGDIPWRVVLDGSNNPQNRVALGYMQADVQVTYLSVIEKFLINVEGGQSVTIQRQSTLPNS